MKYLLSLLLFGTVVAIATHENENVHYRAAKFSTSMQMDENCRKVCSAKKEKWTGNWKIGLLGRNKCECEVQKKKSWFSRKKQPKNIEYRKLGVGKGPHDAASECPTVCGENQEKFTGNWKHNWLSGTHCECKIDESALIKKLQKVAKN